METLPNLICGKFTVGGKDNLPPDSISYYNNYQWLISYYQWLMTRR